MKLRIIDKRLISVEWEQIKKNTTSLILFKWMKILLFEERKKTSREKLYLCINCRRICIK